MTAFDIHSVGIPIITILTGGQRRHSDALVTFIDRLHRYWPAPAALWRPQTSWIAPHQYLSEMDQDNLLDIVMVLREPLVGADLVVLKEFCLSEERTRTTHAPGRALNINPGLIVHDGVVVASHKAKPCREKIGAMCWGQWMCKRNNNGHSCLSTTSECFAEYAVPSRLAAFSRLADSLRRSSRSLCEMLGHDRCPLDAIAR